MKNPFHFNRPARPEDFLGRWAIVEQMVDDLYDWEGESYGIVGGRRFGKSSMLRALEDRLVGRLKQVEIKNPLVLPVYVPLKAISIDSPTDIFGFVQHQLCKIICGQKKTMPQLKGPLLELGFPEYTQRAPSPASLQDLEAYIGKIVVAANPTLGMVRIALLIDEIDEALDFPWTGSLFGNLRSLVYDGDMMDFVRLILAGSERYIDVDTQGSPLSNAITGIYLEPFTEDAARELVGRATGISPNIADEIIRQSGGHPFIIQYILHYLFEANVSSVTIESVHDEVHRFLYERSADLEGWWRGIGENGQRAYSILEQSTDWLTIADIMQIANDLRLQADRGLKALCSHGLAIHDGTYRKYCISGQLFRDWADTRCQALNRKQVRIDDISQAQRYTKEENVRKAREDKEMQKIKALFLAANPTSTSQLALDEEMRTIEQKVRAAEHRDALVFQSSWAVQPDDLLQLLNQHRPHIVHFSGHGSSEGLSLAGEGGQEKIVSTQALKALFRALKDNIQLVLLNACYSREQAQALVETIDCVIGMKESIGDDAAIAFASSFYRAIGFGRSIQEAFDQGITSLLLEAIPEEDIPELLVKDGVDPKQIVLIGQDNYKVPPVPLSRSASPLTANRPIDIFISYAYADKDWCGRLTNRLANLRNQGMIRDWHDGDIVAGTEWRKEIQKRLDEAQIILLLISPDYLASDFCYSVQMKRAIERHKKGTACVVPLLLRTTDYEGTPFAELAMLPSNGKAVSRWADQDEAFQDIITGIRRSIKALLANP